MKTIFNICVFALALLGLSTIPPISDYIYIPWDLKFAQECTEKLMDLSAHNDGSCSPHAKQIRRQSDRVMAVLNGIFEANGKDWRFDSLKQK